MLLYEPERTSFDLNFRLFGTDVRVHPLFWLMAAILGRSLVEQGGNFGYLLLWIACVFVSILLHEMGHVLAGRLFGSDGHIVLHGMGGVAVGSSALASRWQRIVVYSAGPLAQLALWAVVVAVASRLPPPEDLDALERRAWLDRLLVMLVVINLYWPLMNLLPVWPLDGGQISRDVFSGLMPNGGTRFALGLSLVVAVLVAVHAVLAETGRQLTPYLPGGLWAVLLFGMLAVGSYQALQAETQRDRWKRDHRNDDSVPWER